MMHTIKGAELIAAERQRQIKEEGWTPEHDDGHVRGELLDAGLSYIHAAINVGHPALRRPPSAWPWDAEWWKPSGDMMRDLVKAGALIAAEIDRLQREFVRPTVVCLCGSSRFYEAYQKAMYAETMAGRIYLSIGFYPHAAAQMHGEGVGCSSKEKIALDRLHKRKIDLADEILVLNVGGYIGDSTRSEIEYAIAKKKKVRWLETPVA